MVLKLVMERKEKKCVFDLFWFFSIIFNCFEISTIPDPLGVNVIFLFVFVDIITFVDISISPTTKGLLEINTLPDPFGVILISPFPFVAITLLPINCKLPIF